MRHGSGMNAGAGRRAWRGAALVAVVALVTGGCGWLTRADLRDDGTAPGGGVESVATNADGSRTVLVTAAQLVAQDTDQTSDIYLVTNPGRNVELESADLPAGANPEQATITRAGDVLAFASPGRLTADDTDNRRDVYWLDPDNGTLVRVSVDSGHLLDGITSFDAPQFVADGNAIVFFGDDAQNGRHLFLRDLQDETTREIPIVAGRTVVQVDTEGQRLVELDADRHVSVVNPLTAQDLGPGCVASSPVLGAGPTLVAMFEGGTGCPTGPARYDTVAKTFTPFTAPADARFLGLDDSEGILLWQSNDGSQRVYTTSFVTGLTQLVSDTGPLTAPVPALDPTLSGDGSAVAMRMGVPPSAGTGGALGAYLHTTMPPIASDVSPGSIARGQTASVTLDVADTFQGTFLPSFGPGIDVSVQSVAVTETYKAHVTLQVTVHANAAVGPRNLILGETHPVGPTFGGCIGCLTVT